MCLAAHRDKGSHICKQSLAKISRFKTGSPTRQKHVCIFHMRMSTPTHLHQHTNAYKCTRTKIIYGQRVEERYTLRENEFKD